MERFQVRTDLALEARESFEEDGVEIRGVAIEESYDEAVSYTHLTLPTIYAV